MTIVGGFVFPHGAITLDPYTRDLTKQPAYRPETRQHCLELHEAMTAQAEALVDTRPDLILMTTPHGLRLQEHFVAHGNSRSYGSAEWLKEWQEFTAEVDIDIELTGKMVNNLRTAGVQMEMVTVGAPDVQTLPMNWGECIPLWFINRGYKNRSANTPKAIIIGIPIDYQRVPSKIVEFTEFGHKIAHFFGKEMSDKRVAVVVSCDLSHFHSTDPTSPYHYDKDAQPFDDLIVQWSKIDIDLDHLENSDDVLICKAGPLTDHIGSCGYTGLVVLQSILHSTVRGQTSSVTKFAANHVSYSWPTYYGMIVNYFIAKHN